MDQHRQLKFARQRQLGSSHAAAAAVSSSAASRWSPRLILTLISVALTFSLSGNLLSYIGITDYMVSGGNLLAKINPATYFTTLTVGFLAVNGEFGSYVNLLTKTNPGIAIFLGLLSFLIVYLAILGNTPVTAPIDTFCETGLLSILLLRLRTPERELIRNFLHGFMLANSLLAISELVSGVHFIPLVRGSTHGIIPFSTEWRPGAFLGHPLENATVTGAYILILLVSNQKMQLPVRLILLGVNSLALLAFGSRSATALVGMITSGYFGWQFFDALRGKHVRRETMAIFFLAVPSFIIGISILLMSGFLDKFLDRFDNDDGSAAARSIMLDVVTSIPLSELIFAPPAIWTVDRFERYGLFALESCWIGFLVSYGIVGCLIFFPGLLAFVVSILRHTQRIAVLPMLFFFLSASASDSISSKGLIFAQFIAILLTNLRRSAPQPLPIPAVGSQTLPPMTPARPCRSGRLRPAE
jgi:hypothetical protein